MNTNTSQQVRAAVNVILTLSETIREVKEIPSGHLYAHVVGTLTLEAYNRAIDILKGAGLVEKKADVLRWVGPKL